MKRLGVLFLIFGSSGAWGVDLRSVLEKPISPGSMALLVEFPGDIHAVNRLRAGLRVEGAETRAAAARTVGASGAVAALPHVRIALETETEPLRRGR